ncbi:MAG: undecaprenyl-phosphate alpha-N-acetylglucosaminyl 1-phosphate transferase [Haliea sp.]|nr:undecaprenyl-phosphate alpha-N-acetylglucosaminyl 1-phosphate transferase [Haliea sp.]|tara:strand:+ start:80137 stop:81276 length:1140 start_codon:yes stop_codon:yes gene_type:complete
MDATTSPHLLLFTLATVALTHFAILAADVCGLVDHPCARKQHEGSVPLAGGPAIFLSFVFALVVWGLPVLNPWEVVLLGVVFLMGLIDDFRHLSPTVRLGLQALCGVAMATIGNVVLTQVGNLLGFGPIGLSILAIPLTALAFAGVANAYNMIDGIDGLAGMLALIPLCAVGLLAAHAGHPLLPTLLALIIPLAVFLLFNLGPNMRWWPKIFLGDSGSNFLGFVVCATLVYFSQGPGALIHPVTALWLITVPLMDMLATMAVRLREGHHPMRADRRHLHHLLVDLGLSVGGARRAIVAHATAMAVAGILLMRLPDYVSLALYLAVFAAHCVFAIQTRRALQAREDANQAARDAASANAGASPPGAWPQSSKLQQEKSAP